MECNICFEPYSSESGSDHRPYAIVPCGHCNCLGCLNSILNQSTEEGRKCAQCRHVIDSIIVNYALMESINSSQSSSAVAASTSSGVKKENDDGAAVELLALKQVGEFELNEKGEKVFLF